MSTYCWYGRDSLAVVSWKESNAKETCPIVLLGHSRPLYEGDRSSPEHKGVALFVYLLLNMTFICLKHFSARLGTQSRSL